MFNHLSIHQFVKIIILWQTTPKVCGSMCPNTYSAVGASPSPQHIPQRETFPIKWQSQGRPPRSVKVKTALHKKG